MKLRSNEFKGLNKLRPVMMDLNILPNTNSGLFTWPGDDLQHRQNEWLIHLKPGQIQELEPAAQHYLRLGRDIGSIKKRFPPTDFLRTSRKTKQKLLHGIGVGVLRRLPIAQYTSKTAARIFCGIGVHLGCARSQNAARHILGHVRDIGANPNDPSVRIYQTNARQIFHTQSTDIVALMCLKDAKEDGDSLLVSAETIYDEVHSKSSDLLSYFFNLIATDRRGEIPKCMAPL